MAAPVAQAMLRRPARIFSDQAFLKGPRVGGAKPRHQDNFYFGYDDSDHVITCCAREHRQPGARGRVFMVCHSETEISVFATGTALDDTDEANGCMRLVPPPPPSQHTRQPSN
jgi:hypothetical protein